MRTEPTFQQKLVFEMMSKALTEANEANDAIEAKAVRMSAVSSGAASLVGGLAVFSLDSQGLGPMEYSLGAAFCFSALAVVWCTVRLLGPRTHAVVGHRDAEKLWEDYIAVDVDKAFNRSLCSICEAFQSSAEVNETKGTWMAWMLTWVRVQIGALALAVTWRAVVSAIAAME